MASISPDRTRGAFLGLAVGDALGTTVEFEDPGTFPPLTDIVGGGPFALAPGMWTDDTSMALCLAESLLERGFDPIDQLRRYVSWWKQGVWSGTGSCFDIGNTVSAALRRFQATGQPWCGSTDPYASGNGSLMRLSPVPVFYAQRPELAIARAADSSATTHLTRSTLDACRYYAGLILGALHGATKEELLASRFTPVPGLWTDKPLAPEIDAIAAGSFKHKVPPDVRGSGYVVHSLEAALWALHTTNDFRSGCLAAANLGEDADTTAAIYGQLAGALYGASGIPADWLDKLARKDELEAIAARLHEHASRPLPPVVRGSDDAPLRLDVLPRAVVPFVGSIGLTFAPGKQHHGAISGPWKRDVATDLARLIATYETKHLVILLEDHELESYMLAGLVEAAEASQLQVHRLPIVDGAMPRSIPELVALVGTIVRAAEAGENVAIVCRGGLGRTGLVAACTLVALGQEPDEAIRLVRATRKGAVENQAQERFVREQAKALRGAIVTSS